jgi:hypothetical protein
LAKAAIKLTNGMKSQNIGKAVRKRLIVFEENMLAEL